MASEVHESTEAPGGGASGLPQFEGQWWAGEIFWFSLIFLVVFILMWKVFVPRVGGAIDDREDRIAGDISNARALKEQAESQAAAAEADMAQARARSQRETAEAKARIQAEAAKRAEAEEAKLAVSIAAAEAAIRAARDEAMGHVREIAADTAAVIVVKLTGQPASAADIRTALAGQA